MTLTLLHQQEEKGEKMEEKKMKKERGKDGGLENFSEMVHLSLPL